MIHDIKSLLDSLLSNQNDWKIQLLNNWPKIMGNLSSKVSIEKINDDTLILAVVDSCWLQELYLMSTMLLKRINEKLDQPRIKQLRFKTAGRVQTKNKSAATIPTQKQRTPRALTSNEEHALDAIKDEELQQALKDFLNRCDQENE